MNLRLTKWQFKQLCVLALVLLCDLLPRFTPDPPMAAYAMWGMQFVVMGVLMWRGFKMHWPTLVQIIIFSGSVVGCAHYANEGLIARTAGMCEAQTGRPVTLIALSWAFLAIAIILRSKDGGAK